MSNEYDLWNQDQNQLNIKIKLTRKVRNYYKEK